MTESGNEQDAIYVVWKRRAKERKKIREIAKRKS